MGEDDSDDRAAILRRRAVFLMSAVAGIGLGSCGDDRAPPNVCLSPIRPSVSPVDSTTPPDAGPADASSPDDAGHDEAGPPLPPAPPPDVCLKVAPR